MGIEDRILLLLKQNERKPIIKSNLMALMYIIDENIGDTEHYSNSVGSVSVSINSDEISNNLNKLDSNGYINAKKKPTFGGDIRVQYRINKSGLKELESRDINQNTKEIVSSVYNEYSGYPISNLLKEINEQYINSWKR